MYRSLFKIQASHEIRMKTAAFNSISSTTDTSTTFQNDASFALRFPPIWALGEGFPAGAWCANPTFFGSKSFFIFERISTPFKASMNVGLRVQLGTLIGSTWRLGRFGIHLRLKGCRWVHGLVSWICEEMTVFDYDSGLCHVGKLTGLIERVWFRRASDYLQFCWMPLFCRVDR